MPNNPDWLSKNFWRSDSSGDRIVWSCLFFRGKVPWGLGFHTIWSDGQAVQPTESTLVHFPLQGVIPQRQGVGVLRPVYCAASRPLQNTLPLPKYRIYGINNRPIRVGQYGMKGFAVESERFIPGHHHLHWLIALPSKICPFLPCHSVKWVFPSELF